LNGRTGLLFLFDAEPISKEHLRWVWDRALERAGIETKGRKLTPYSLRYTWRSKMAGRMRLKDIMEAQGHRSEEMSRHYLHIDPEMFGVFDDYQQIIDETWNQ
jgi:integrase